MRYLNSAGLLRFHGKMMKRLNGKVKEYDFFVHVHLKKILSGEAGRVK